MVKLPDNAVAYCHIKSQDDNRNVCVLTTNALEVSTRGIKKTYLLSNIANIAIKQKKMLFPIIAGGIVGSLFFIASFNFVINLWLSLSLSGLGFVLFYYGWQGSPTISIKTKVKEYDHFINTVSQALHLFIEFINYEIIPSSNSELCFYIKLDNEDWVRQQQSEEIEVKGKKYLQTQSQLSINGNEVILKIVISRLIPKIAIEIHEGQLHPYVTGNINLDALELINY